MIIYYKINENILSDTFKDLEKLGLIADYEQMEENIINCLNYDNFDVYLSIYVDINTTRWFPTSFLSADAMVNSYGGILVDNYDIVMLKSLIESKKMNLL